MSVKFEGVIISPLTPFTQEGALDEAAISNLIEFLIGKGVRGIFALGTAGQGPLMSVDERKRVAEIIVNQCRGRIPVMVQVGALTSKESAVLAEHACSIGADAIAVVPPLYVRVDMNSIEQHYAAIAAASSLPIFVYNNPWAQGRALTPEELLYLNEKNLISGVVDSSRELGNIYKLLRYKDRLTVIIADTKLSMPALLFGCPAVVSAVGGVIPEPFVEMFDAVQEGNISRAVELENEVFSISEPLRSPEIGAFHEALATRGVPCGVPRLPVRMPNAKEKETINSAMQNYKL